MADKTASVRIGADARGFLAGMKQAEAGAKQAGAKIDAALTGAVNNAGKKMRDASGRYLKQGAEDGARGMLNSLRDVETKSKGIFQRMGEAAKKAFAGVAKYTDAKGFLTGAGLKKKESASETLGGYARDAAGMAVNVTGKALGDANRVLDKATRISIGARGAGQQAVDPRELMAEFYEVTQEVHGVTADAAADAVARFVSMTGDLKTARNSLVDFALISQASGASMEDVAATAAAISQQFGITDPRDIQDTMAALLAQGKSGAFELKDAASLFPSLAAAGASFGLDKGVGGVKTLGGIVQIAKTGAGSGEVAATNVQAMLTALKTNADKLQAAGTKVYEGSGANKKTRDLPTIIAEMIAKTGGTDLAKKNAGLTDVLTATGFKAIAPLVTQYQDMFAQSKGKTDQARQADAMEQLRLKILESVNAAGTWADVVNDAGMAASTSSATMTASWESFTGKVGEKVLPKFAALGEKVLATGGAFDMLFGALSTVVDITSFVGDQFMWLARQVSGNSESDQLRDQHKFQVAGRDRARKELAGLQMSPEDIAQMQKEDPSKLAALRSRAQQLQDTANRYDEQASATWDKFRQTDAGKRAAATVAGWNAEGNQTGAPVKAELDTSKEMRVRITNPKEVGAGGQGAAPKPGWMPP